jgi:hypothetical protein
MNFGTIDNANLRLVGDPEHGILDVMARRVTVGEYYETTVAVFPTREEMERMLDGQPILLTVLGNSWPPVRLEVQS